MIFLISSRVASPQRDKRGDLVQVQCCTMPDVVGCWDLLVTLFQRNPRHERLKIIQTPHAESVGLLPVPQESSWRTIPALVACGSALTNASRERGDPTPFLSSFALLELVRGLPVAQDLPDHCLILSFRPW